MKLLLILALIWSFTNNAIAANGSGNVSNIANTSAFGASVASSAASIPQGIGGGLFHLVFGTASSSTADYYYPLLKDGTAYRASATKSTYCFNFVSQSSTQYGQLQIAYSTTNSIAVGGASSWTGVVWQGGQSTASGAQPFQTSVGGAYTFNSHPGVFIFPANAYAGVQVHIGAASYSLHMDCFEQ